MPDKAKDQGHKLTLADRAQLSLTGVQKVQSFDPKEIILETVLGVLSVKGGGLGVKHLDLQGGIVEIEGTVDTLNYLRRSGAARRGLLNRMFR